MTYFVRATRGDGDTLRIYEVQDDGYVWYSDYQHGTAELESALIMDLEPGYLDVVVLAFDSEGNEYVLRVHPDENARDPVVVAELSGKTVKGEARAAMVRFASKNVGFSLDALSFEDLLNAVVALTDKEPVGVITRIRNLILGTNSRRNAYRGYG